MEVFDGLPRSIKEALNYAWVNYCPIQAYDLYMEHNCNEGRVLSIIRKSDILITEEEKGAINNRTEGQRREAHVGS